MCPPLSIDVHSFAIFGFPTQAILGLPQEEWSVPVENLLKGFDEVHHPIAHSLGQYRHHCQKVIAVRCLVEAQDLGPEPIDAIAPDQSLNQSTSGSEFGVCNWVRIAIGNLLHRSSGC
jgi:hypothetical protein